MKNKLVLAVGVAALALSSTVAFAITGNGSEAVTKLLSERLPKTKVSSVDCEAVNGICEVVAGSNLFYVDKSARYLIVGRVYDMETRRDVTAARLLDINPDLLIGGAASAAKSEHQADDPEFVSSNEMRPSGAGVSERIDPKTLPAGGAIVHGKKNGTPVYVFSDFNCSYCRALNSTLKSMNVKIYEYPISILGSRHISERVFCAANPGQAAQLAYERKDLRMKRKPECDTSPLDKNEAFARKNGLGGTPVIVRQDGAVLQGYRPKEFLTRWIAGEVS